MKYFLLPICPHINISDSTFQASSEITLNNKHTMGKRKIYTKHFIHTYCEKIPIFAAIEDIFVKKKEDPSI